MIRVQKRYQNGFNSNLLGDMAVLKRSMHQNIQIFRFLKIKIKILSKLPQLTRTKSFVKWYRGRHNTTKH